MTISNTEMFDNAAVVCKTVPPGFSPRQERPFIDMMWENVRFPLQL